MKWLRAIDRAVQLVVASSSSYVREREVLLLHNAQRAMDQRIVRLKVCVFNKSILVLWWWPKELDGKESVSRQSVLTGTR